MKTKFEILNFLENTFLAIQNKINAIKPGSVIRSIFYSVASAIEDVYVLIDEVKQKSYIHTATGEYLDQLIYGFSKLERIRGRRAFGYVVLSPIGFNFDSIQSIDLLSNIIFSKYDIKNNLIYSPPLSAKFSISTAYGIFDYLLLPPIKLSLQYEDDFYYEINPNTGKQRIAEIFAETIKANFLQNPTKRIKYIVLPIISEDFGKEKNLLPSSIDVVLQFGTAKFSLSNNFEYTLLTDEIFVDLDSVSSYEDTLLILGEASEIKGGSSEETDEEYRNRYWNFLNSLSKGTVSSIENALSQVIQGAKVRAINSPNPGVIDVYIYSDTQTISNSLVLLSQEIVDEVKPAGSIINIRFPKTIYINLLVDSKKSITKNDIESIRLKFRDSFSELNIGDSFSYEKFWEFLSDQNSSFANPMFGLSLNREFFELYKDGIKKFVCLNYYESHTYFTTLPDFCSGSSEFTYSDYLNIISEGKIALYIYDKNNNYKSYITNNNYSSQLNIQAPRYPLKKVISRVLGGEEILHPSIRNAIKARCRNISADICLKEISRNGDLNASEIQSRIAIPIFDLDEVYANYFKIKLMTLPVRSTNDIELCENKISDYSYCSGNSYEFKILYFLLNDVQYIEYKDLDEIQYADGLIRLQTSSQLNKDFIAKYNVAVRSEQ